METATRKRRSRTTPAITTGSVKPSLKDARGFADPLARYGELPTSILVEFYKVRNNLRPQSWWPIHRLKELWHERAGMEEAHQILSRPHYQWRHGFNHQTIYRRALGTGRLLVREGLYDQQALSWIGTTSIVQLSRDEKQQPSDHDAALSIYAASIEIAARRSLKYYSHIDILKHASPDAQQASSPLSIPIPKLEHAFSGDRKPTVILNTFVKPDNLFGLEYPGGDQKFAVVEYDRSTEDVEPTRSLSRKSWLRKVLCYSAISVGQTPLYESYLKVPNLLVLGIFSDERRMSHVKQVIAKYARYPGQFRCMTVPAVDPLLEAKLIPQLFLEEWSGVNSTFNLSTGKERR